MQAVMQSRKPRREVKSRRNGDDRGVELLALEHVVPGCVWLDGVLTRHGGGEFGVLVAYGDQLGALQVAEDTKVVAAHGAEADEAEPGHVVDAALRTASTMRSR